jgi:hypothetical protein
MPRFDILMSGNAVSAGFGLFLASEQQLLDTLSRFLRRFRGHSLAPPKGFFMAHPLLKCPRETSSACGTLPALARCSRSGNRRPFEVRK